MFIIIIKIMNISIALKSNKISLGAFTKKTGIHTYIHTYMSYKHGTI
jgi:hypothetical protein